MNEVTRTNLQRVVDELPEIAKTKPSIITDFDMYKYGCMDARKNMNECGAVGCMLGNFVHVFPPVESDFISEQFQYAIFIRRIVPNLHTIQFNFLFDGYWGNYDNTFKGAIKRIKYFLSVDGEVEDFNYEDFSKGWNLKDSLKNIKA